MNQVKIRVKSAGIRGFQPGQIVRAEADEHGTPLDPTWRRRLRDARHDDCCELVVEQPTEAPRRHKSKNIPVQDGTPEE